MINVGRKRTSCGSLRGGVGLGAGAAMGETGVSDSCSSEADHDKTKMVRANAMP